jgi:HrpA-like RNA helicase
MIFLHFQGVTEVKVMTGEWLLQEVLADPILGAYSALIVDDVQLRSASTDLLLGLLRKVCLFSADTLIP